MGEYVNSIKAFKTDCVREASKLGDYQKMSITDLANNYCAALDSEDTIAQNKYIAALMLRFWYTIDKVYKATVQHNAGDLADFTTIIYERIMYACKYRAWQKDNATTNAQACINQAIMTEIKNMHVKYDTFDKYKVATKSVSLDTPLDGESSDSDTLSDIIEDDSNDIKDFNIENNLTSFIQAFINENKYVEAVILDTIAYNNDAIKMETTRKCRVDEEGKKDFYKETTSEFWPYKAVQKLNALPDNYSKYFKTRYKVDSYVADVVIDAVKAAPNPKKYRYLYKTLEAAKPMVNMLMD